MSYIRRSAYVIYTKAYLSQRKDTKSPQKSFSVYIPPSGHFSLCIFHKLLNVIASKWSVEKLKAFQSIRDHTDQNDMLRMGIGRLSAQVRERWWGTCLLAQWLKCNNAKIILVYNKILSKHCSEGDELYRKLNIRSLEITCSLCIDTIKGAHIRLHRSIFIKSLSVLHKLYASFKYENLYWKSQISELLSLLSYLFRAEGGIFG